MNLHRHQSAACRRGRSRTAAWYLSSCITVAYRAIHDKTHSVPPTFLALQLTLNSRAPLELLQDMHVPVMLSREFACLTASDLLIFPALTSSA